MPSVGSHVPKAKDSGTWKSWSNFWAKHSGSWKKPLGVYVKSGGSWVKVWDERPTITLVERVYYTYPYAPGLYFSVFGLKFTVSANGFDTSLSSSVTEQPSPSSVSANTTSGTISVGVQYNGYYTDDPAKYPIITATNASGTSTLQ